MLKAVFDLRNAQAYVATVQDATLNSAWAGLVPDHGLFGSSEWWKAIDDGRIRTHRVSGTISRVFMSGHNDYPEFELDSDGKKTHWTREGLDDEYVVGRPATIEYVLQRFKTPLEGVGEYSECVLRILIDDGRGA